MRRIPARPLTENAFRVYGSCADLMRPENSVSNGQAKKFFRELCILGLGRETNAAFSTLKVRKVPPIVEATEFHAACGEGLFVVDGDVVMHVGPPTANRTPPLDDFEAFVVPAGTFVSLRPGVWHYEPFALTNDVVCVIIVLPERTYANDTCFVELSSEDRIEIEVPRSR